MRDGKGDKDRVTMLPAAVKAELARHLELTREQHRRDLLESMSIGSPASGAGGNENDMGRLL